MKLLKKFLADAQASGGIVTVFRDALHADRIDGRILAYSSNVVQIEKYFDTGQYAGIVFVRTEDITRVRFGGRARAFILQSAEKHQVGTTAPDGSLVDLWHALQYVQKEYGYAGMMIESCDNDLVLIGEVVESDKSFVRLLEHGTIDTQDERELLLAKDEITLVGADSPYERSISRLRPNMRPLDRRAI